jgi:hypothetical protein
MMRRNVSDDFLQIGRVVLVVSRGAVTISCIISTSNALMKLGKS